VAAAGIAGLSPKTPPLTFFPNKNKGAAAP